MGSHVTIAQHIRVSSPYHTTQQWPLELSIKTEERTSISLLLRTLALKTGAFFLVISPSSQFKEIDFEK